MSAVAIAELSKFDEPSASAFDPVRVEAGSCVVCGHPEEVHELLLTSSLSWVICHERTVEGECFRVRHSKGIAFGACRRDPA